ncbi:phosphopantetheine-binding protein [Desulfovibrio sp.]|uniref:phosphopantetheine-binding protein n=1 Tax=Desulfovibrio sp. TaxID=885 RepID=UPI0025BA037C|nr:phosphopantetheine-binding protein [Desulfovibrio sp.]MCI7569539.1 phosphopantetheine-binding protein [Desulfovibrio sp.]
MQLTEFLLVFQDILQRDEPLAADDALVDIEEWDSLAVMATIAWFDRNLGKKLTFRDFKGLKSVADIAALAGIVQ